MLEASIRSRHYPSLIFAGPRGVGKRTLALLYAQALNCSAGAATRGRGDVESSHVSSAAAPCGKCPECTQIARMAHPDVKVVMPLKPEGRSEDETRRARDAQKLIDETMTRAADFAPDKVRPETEAKWQISIPVIHWLRGEMAYAPIRAKRRVVIVLDADQMNPISSNAFLKTLEEPQRQTSFILVTERSHRLLDTIRSRCQMVGFSFLGRDEIAGYLIEKRGAGEKQAKLAAEFSGGSLRKALEYLDAPDDFLNPQALEFFSNARPSLDDCRNMAEQADRMPVESVIDSLVFLYDQTLRSSLGIQTEFLSQNPELKKRAAPLGTDAIRRQLEILLKARREFEYNVNRRLFLFALLSTLAETKSAAR